MARVQFSGLVTSIQGKLGGAVFQRTKSGVILKNATPGTRTTEAKEQQLARVAAATALWNTVTTETQSQWNSWAETYGRRSPYPNQSRPTGRELFISYMTIALRRNPATTTLQATNAPGSILFARPEILNDMGALIWIPDATEEVGNWQAGIYLGRPVHPWQDYKKDRTRYIAEVSLPHAGGEVNVTTQYTAIFGILPEPDATIPVLTYYRQNLTAVVIYDGPYLHVVQD